MSFLWKLLGGDLISGVGNIVKTIFGDKEKRDKQSFDLNAATLNQFAAEFSMPRRNWFDSVIDGLNRLPRPIMALGVIALFVWCVIDPAPFAVSMQALGLIPEPMWWMMGVIVTFFFGDRAMQGFRKFKGPSAQQVKDVLESRKAIQAIATPQVSANAQSATEIAAPPISDAEYKKEIASPEPLSDASIQRWNAEYTPGYRNPSIAAWRAKAK